MLYYKDKTCITTYYQGKAPPTMMIKCQKCGFENQMGSIFCRECGEKLDMDAIDPNKLQKDVDKEKLRKATKKRIKGLISGAVSILVIVAFIFVVFPGLFPFYNQREYEEPEVQEANATKKYNDTVNGNPSKMKYSYPEINQMIKTQILNPLSEEESFAKVTALEVAYDAAKSQPVVYVWIKLKDKVPVLYTIYGKITYNMPSSNPEEPQPETPISLKTSRLDIGLLPVPGVAAASFLNGFKPLLDNSSMRKFFKRAQTVKFSEDGMTVDFVKSDDEDGGSSFAPAAPSSSTKTSASAPKNSLSSAKNAATTATAAKNSALSPDEEAAKQKAEAEKAERKRKAEEYRQQQQQKEEERKRKIEEENERRKQEQEERRRKQEEENERRRQERENRRNNNNNYNNNNRNSRSSRSSRNNRY